MKRYYKYVIIGAGLSGFVTGYKLLEAGEEYFIILEARDRVGGRILNKETVDFRATWLQSYHTSLLNLLEELGI
jgi:monoamine oxidase